MVSEMCIRDRDVTGVLIPGGFGKRGTEGKIAAIKYARLNNIPFFGICFGMQLAVIEAMRNLKGYENASSTEFGKCKIPVVSLISEWKQDSEIRILDKENLGGSMRLGSYESILCKNSKISKKATIF